MMNIGDWWWRMKIGFVRGDEYRGSRERQEIIDNYSVYLIV